MINATEGNVPERRLVPSEERNPYAAPRTRIAGRRRRRNRPRDDEDTPNGWDTYVNVMSGIFIACTLLMAILCIGVITENPELRGLFGVFCAFMFFMAVTYFCVIKRMAWARIFGILLSVLGLLAFPIGTVIHIFLLIGYANVGKKFR